jgi:hypothetical protein
MNRSVFAPALTLLCSVAVTAVALAQAPPAPATKAKWVAPIKGIAAIELLQGQPKKVGNEMVTVLKVKNISPGAIALLRADETWYDKSLKVVSGDTFRVKQPILPGEVVEITLKSPITPAVAPTLYRNRIDFSHANGKIDVRAVKKFSS